MIDFKNKKIMDKYPKEDFAQKYIDFSQGYGSEDRMSDFESK